jgi:hypothetical protein
VRFILGIILGIGLGLVYGWLLTPVEFVDTSPDSLRADYRTDYVLMVSEAYQRDVDAEEARRRLAALGPDAPAQIVAGALEFAQDQGFAGLDIERLEGLHSALERRLASPEIRNP